MPSRDDRRAALILLGLAATGLALRLVVATDVPPGGIAFRAGAGGRPSRDSVAERAARLVRPLRRDEKIDVDRAPAEELVRLPRIGPALAARIVADREANGAFGSLEVLDRVSGVGPAVLKAIGRHASFSGMPRRSVPKVGKPSLNTASVEELARLPGIGPVRARAIVEDRVRRGLFRRLEDLERVAGIGPGTVAALRGRVRVP
jgi:competence protein ComEA